MNFDGGANNKAFKTGVMPGDPYYYISASLNLTGLHTGAVVETDPYIYYFNRENNFNYLDSSLHPNIDAYGGYYMIDTDSVIGEVTVYANPSIIYEGNILDLEFEVGGVYKPSIALNESLNPIDLTVAQSMDVWGGPTGYVPGSVTVAQLEDGQICYYGREPQNPNPNPPNVDNLEFGSRRYLALRFVALLVGNDAVDRSSESRRSAREIPRTYRPRKPIARNPIQPQKTQVVNRTVRVVAEPLIEVGKFHVVVKVYPKATVTAS